MKEKELNTFLASVRRTRFVDYLDPLGETAQNALERRLSWARVSQHDPAYAGEARFLLDNAEGLRDVLRRELEEDDWVEEADVGREWETREPSRSARMRENDRVTEIFQADDLEVSSAPQKVQLRPTKGGAPLPPSARSTPKPSTQRTVSRSVAVSEAQAPKPQSDLRKTESPTPSSQAGKGGKAGARPEPARVTSRVTPDPDGRQRTSEPPPRRGAETAPRGVETARRAEPPRGATPAGQSRSNAGHSPSSTGAHPVSGSRVPPPPAPAARSATPAPTSRVPTSVPPRGTPGPTSRSGYHPIGTADSLPPLQDSRGPGSARPDPSGKAPNSYGARSETTAPLPPAKPPVRDTSWNEPTQRNQPIGRRGRPETPRAATKPKSIEDENTSPLPPHGSAPEDVDFEGWDAPEDPVSTTGIMRLEDVGPSRREEVIGVNGVETLTTSRAPPRPTVTAAVVIDETATAPSAATRLRRPQAPDSPEAAEKRAMVMAAMPMPKVRASVDPTPRRSRLPALIIGLAMVALLVVVAAGAVIVPVVYSQTDFGLSLPEEMVRVEPVPIAEPVPVDPVPAPPPAPENPPVAPEPSKVGIAAVAPVAAPVAPPPVTPSPVVKAAPSKAPPPKPAQPEPPPAPRSSAPPPEIGGLWIGSTSTGLSFKLTVLGQTDGDFEGTVEVQIEDMTFQSFAINGKIEGGGALNFKGDGASFSGKITGRKAAGTYTLPNGATGVSWSALH